MDKLMDTGVVEWFLDSFSKGGGVPQSRISLQILHSWASGYDAGSSRSQTLKHLFMLFSWHALFVCLLNGPGLFSKLWTPLVFFISYGT